MGFSKIFIFLTGALGPMGPRGPGALGPRGLGAPLLLPGPWGPWALGPRGLGAPLLLPGPWGPGALGPRYYYQGPGAPGVCPTNYGRPCPLRVNKVNERPHMRRFEKGWLQILLRGGHVPQKFPGPPPGIPWGPLGSPGGPQGPQGSI